MSRKAWILAQATVSMLSMAGVVMETNTVRGASAAVAGDDRDAKETTCIDASFARAALKYAEAPTPGLREELLKSTGLQAIIRHCLMSGAPNTTPDTALASLKLPKKDFPAIAKLIDQVQGRADLCDLWRESAALLPKGFTFKGKIRLILGYDVGVASPPDILINIGASKYLEHPAEIEPWIIHETHHVGFLQFSPRPPVDHLEKKENLLRHIRWCTQLEGMAVYAAYAYRKTHGLLQEDGDYLIYEDDVERKRVTAEYRKLYLSVLNSTASPPDHEEVEEIMSSGRRLWYRLGAWASYSIERRLGNQVLVETVANPEVFWKEIESAIK